jgi:hypothetical protein
VIEALIEKLSDPGVWELTSRVASTFAVLGVLVAALALIGSWRANKANAKAERARFWLDLRTMFASHNEVHKKLRPGGDWREKGKEDQPARGSDGEAALIAYMGLFEHCEYMLEDKLLDEKTFKKIYAYRLDLLLKNKSVKRRLADYDDQGRFVKHKSWSGDEGGWDALQKLLKRFRKLKMLESPVPPPKKKSTSKEPTS